MRRLEKYWHLYQAFFRTSLVADLEYRANFLSRIVTDIFWYAAQIITFETLYRHTETIGSWNLHQARVFLGLLFVSDAIYMVVFSDNLDHLSEKVRKGELDLLLAKPVNSQFMISLNRVNTAILGNLLLGSAWLIWALSQLPDFNWYRLLWLILLIPCGVLCSYAVKFLFCASAVIFTKSENLQFIWYQIYKLGMRPDSIYVPWLKILLMTVLPVALMASVPARALMEPPNPLLVVTALAVTAAFLWISHRFWRFALGFYTSASS